MKTLLTIALTVLILIAISVFVFVAGGAIVSWAWNLAVVPTFSTPVLTWQAAAVILFLIYVATKFISRGVSTK